MSMFSHYRVNADHQIPEIRGDYVDTNANEPYIDMLNRKLKIEVTNLSSESIEFDLVGVDAAIANALRRILLAEVRLLSQSVATKIHLLNVFLAYDIGPNRSH